MHSTELIFNPPIIAHRGASHHAPENTVAAFRKVKDLGVNWVEFDVMLSACGTAIVIHDETLERTTNGQGNVSDFSYEELKKLDAGSWFNEHFCDQRIPTLEEVISILIELNLSANIEIKPVNGYEKSTVKKVLSILESTDHASFKYFLSSFSKKTLEFIREQNEKVLIGYLMHDWDVEWKIFCEKYRCDLVDVNAEILTREKVFEIKKNNKKLLAYTVNDVSQAKKLLAWGVDAIFSDCPQTLIDQLKF